MFIVRCFKMLRLSHLIDVNGFIVPNWPFILQLRKSQQYISQCWTWLIKTRYEFLGSFIHICEYSEGIWLFLKWDKLFNERDSTWASLVTIHKDIADMVHDFLEKEPRRCLAYWATTQLGLSYNNSTRLAKCHGGSIDLACVGGKKWLNCYFSGDYIQHIEDNVYITYDVQFHSLHDMDGMK